MSRPEEEERATQDINVKECESLTATSFFQSLQLQTVHSIQEAPREDNYKEPKKSFLSYIKRVWDIYKKDVDFLISRQSCDDVREQFGVEAQWW